MPDWFYRTVTQPLFFRMPAVRARDFALGFMGRLCRVPFGPAAIDFLGHMRADPRLRRSFLGLDFPTALGLGPGLDAKAAALPALARFGLGFLDVGPVTVNGRAGGRPIARLAEREAVWSPDPPESLSLAGAAPRLAEAARQGVPLIVRLGEQPAADCARIVRELAPSVHLFALPTFDLDSLRGVLAAARSASPPRHVLLTLPADLDLAGAEAFVDAAGEAGVDGLLIDGSVRSESDGRLSGAPARTAALEQVRHWRSRFGKDLFLIAGGGVHEPADALALREAGADLVEVDTGLVYTGPGLPKRINDAFLYEDTRSAIQPPEERAPERSWFWTALMGAGMLFGSVLALVIAVTRVVLP
jgi:dihydroorotate dehydrogenase